MVQGALFQTGALPEPGRIEPVFLATCLAKMVAEFGDHTPARKANHREVQHYKNSTHED